MKPVRLAIIGCGGFVRYHVRGMKEGVPEFRCVALVDNVRKKARALAEEHFAEAALAIHTDHAAMLKQVRPAAVIVSTPHTLHFRHGYDALSAGAHVMIEKPMVTDADDARKLVAKARAKRRILQIAVQGTYTDTFAYARGLIRDGTIGPLQLVTGVMAQGWMAGTRGQWRQNPRLSGGGQLYDSTAHVLTAMMFLVDSPVREVFCALDKKGTRVDINAVATIRFANGCLGSLASGGNCPSFHSHLIFQGANALMEISPHGGNFRVASRKLKTEITAVPRGWKVPTVSPVRNFADAIRRKAKPRCTGRLGILLADLMDALYESARAGKPAKVTRRPPKA